MDMPFAPRRRPRTLALELVDALGDRIRDGRLAPGAKLPTEAAIMAEFGVSRTVVREAISKLQAGGLVATRHGVGTFVVGFGDAAPFRIAPEQFATLRDVIAVLELRIGVETEAAGLAAQRRSADNLATMREIGRAHV
jgi:DNA-binding FadR family transcriptional regulator